MQSKIEQISELMYIGLTLVENVRCTTVQQTQGSQTIDSQMEQYRTDRTCRTGSTEQNKKQITLALF